MTDAEVVFLTLLIKHGRDIRWIPDSETCQKIIHVGDREGEPAGSFADGTYVALDCCDFSDFVEVTPVFKPV